MNYDMDTLIEAFSSHAETSEKDRLKALVDFPDQEWPKEEFCLPRALQAMCEEIKKLRQVG